MTDLFALEQIQKRHSDMPKAAVMVELSWGNQRQHCRGLGSACWP